MADEDLASRLDNIERILGLQRLKAADFDESGRAGNSNLSDHCGNSTYSVHCVAMAEKATPAKL